MKMIGGYVSQLSKCGKTAANRSSLVYLFKLNASVLTVVKKERILRPFICSCHVM